MRTATQQELALLSSPSQSYRTWIKVEMTRVSSPLWGSETWVDLTNLNGFDWVIGVDYSESIDTPAWSATVTLHSHLTDNPTFTLSPFISASPNNTDGILVQPYRKIRISTAVVPIGDAKPSTFNVVFVGRVDNWSMTDGTIVLNCRDRTAELMDFFLKDVKRYGDDLGAGGSGNELETIIQDILDDHYNNATNIGGSDGDPYTLYSQAGTAATPWAVADATGWLLRAFNATKSPVWEWLSRLSQMIGYQIRMRWHEGSGIDDFVLVLEEPNRSASTADFTLDPTAGQVRIDSVSLSNANVRNYVRVGYALNGGEDDSTETSDATSITKYGERFMEIQESSSSQIDTSAEAEAMRDAILADTKDPTAQVQLTCPYLWFAQLNDLVGISADNFFFDSAQKFAILSRRNTIQQGGPAQTVLICEGLPKSGKQSHASNQRQYNKPRPSPDKVMTSINYGGVVSNSTLSDLSDE